MAQIVRRLQGRRPCAHDMRQRTAADGDELVRPHIYIICCCHEARVKRARMIVGLSSGRGFKAPAPPPRYSCIKISTPGHAPPRPRTSHKTAPPSQAKPAETRHAVDKVARWLADLVHSSRRYKFETDGLEAPESRSRAFGKPTPKTTSAFFAGGAGLDGWPLARDVRRGRGARTSSGKGTGCRCDSRSGCRKGGRPSHHRPIQCDCDCGASGGPGTGS